MMYVKLIFVVGFSLINSHWLLTPKGFLHASRLTSGLSRNDNGTIPFHSPISSCHSEQSADWWVVEEKSYSLLVIPSPSISLGVNSVEEKHPPPYRHSEGFVAGGESRKNPVPFIVIPSEEQSDESRNPLEISNQ